MNTEHWRPIDGYGGLYEVSDHGRVRSLHMRHGKVVVRKLQNKRGGYKMIALNLDGKKRTHQVHVLVAAAFIGPRPNGMYVCHQDGNPVNNYVFNLRYDTPRGNSIDRFLHGTMYRQRVQECPRGHSMADAISRPRKRPNLDGTLGLDYTCRTCNRIKNKAYYYARKARKLAEIDPLT